MPASVASSAEIATETLARENSISSSDEPEMVARALAGDERAWIALIRNHQQAVFHLAWLLLNNRDDAEEVAQETFVQAFSAMDRFDSSRPLRPWLLRIAHNLALNRRRSLRRAWQTVQAYFGIGANGAESSPTEEEWHASEALRSAISRLSNADRQIIYLRYYLELSIEECAEILEVAPGTVKSRLHRALNRLRPLARHEFGEEA